MDEIMKDREAFFIIGIITTVAGLYLAIFVQTMIMDFGSEHLVKISTIFDGEFLTIMGTAIVFVSSREWDSEKGSRKKQGK